MLAAPSGDGVGAEGDGRNAHRAGLGAGDQQRDTVDRVYADQRRDQRGDAGQSERSFFVSPSPGTRQLRFTVARRSVGSTTVPLVITDACGTWSSLVGGGASAF